jgi:hypothetical protein
VSERRFGSRPAVIDPVHASIWARCDHETANAPHGLLERLLPTSRSRYCQSERLRYREAIIEVGATIDVVGSATREPDPEEMPTGIYRDGHANRLRFRGCVRHPLVICEHVPRLRS